MVKISARYDAALFETLRDEKWEVDSCIDTDGGETYAQVDAGWEFTCRQNAKVGDDTLIPIIWADEFGEPATGEGAFIFFATIADRV